MDFGLARKAAVWCIAVAGLVLGAPSALSMQVFQNQDWVWGLGLILSGGFFAFGVITYGVRRFRHDYLAGEGEGRRGVGAWFDPVLMALIPLQFFCLLGWWGWKSFTWTEGQGDLPARLRTWLDPTDLFSIGTCLAQWGVLLVIGFGLNRWLAARTAPER